MLEFLMILCEKIAAFFNFSILLCKFGRNEWIFKQLYEFLIFFFSVLHQITARIPIHWYSNIFAFPFAKKELHINGIFITSSYHET